MRIGPCMLVGLSLMALPALAHGGRGGGQGLLEAFDTNGDGQVAQMEIDQTRTDRRDQFDRNGDGRLSRAAYEALWTDAIRERKVDPVQRLPDEGDAGVERKSG